MPRACALERVMVVETTSSGWRPGALAVVLHSHIGGWWVGRGMAVDDLPTHGICIVAGGGEPATWSE